MSKDTKMADELLNLIAKGVASQLADIHQLLEEFPAAGEHAMNEFVEFWAERLHEASGRLDS